MKSIFFSPFILAVSAVLLVGFHSLSASWTPPTATPPGDNVAPVVNTGSTTQVKTGNFGGAVVAATAEMRSDRYCNGLGTSCFTIGSSTGGWVATNQQIYNGAITGSGFGDTGGVDLNLSSIVGERETLVQLMVTTVDNTSNSFSFKPKGVAGVQGSTVGSGAGSGAAGLQIYGSANRIGYVTVTTNNQGIVLMQSYTTQNVTVRLVGYIDESIISAVGGGVPSEPSAPYDTPSGAVLPFNLTTCPTGWIPSDGTNGTVDMRNRFVRGLGTGRTLGSFQDDAFQGHAHQVSAQSNGPGGGNGTYMGTSGGRGAATLDDRVLGVVGTYVGNPFGTARVADETRPDNIALLYCQKQ